MSVRRPDGYVIRDAEGYMRAEWRGITTCMSAAVIYDSESPARTHGKIEIGDTVEPVYIGEPTLARASAWAGELLAAANVARQGLRARLCSELGLPIKLVERDDFEVAVGEHFEAQLETARAELPPGVERAGWIGHVPVDCIEYEAIYIDRDEAVRYGSGDTLDVREVFVGPVEHSEPEESPATVEARKWIDCGWAPDDSSDALLLLRPDGFLLDAYPSKAVMIEIRRLLVEEGEPEGSPATVGARQWIEDGRPAVAAWLEEGDGEA